MSPFLFHALRHGTLPAAYSGEGFAAFYCAGEAVRERRDPYLVEPLRSCEAAAHVIPESVVEPAPLPPVTLGFFALLAALPYGFASALWETLLVACVGICGVGLVRLAPNVPPLAIWLSLLPGLLVLNGFYGETPPFVAAALVLGGLFLRAGRTLPAVAAVTVAALLEPHVGGAAWLALLLFVPAARVALLASGAALAGGCVLTVGYPTAVSYLAVVLPAHAISELPANDQYSLTSLLFQVGVSAHTAVTAGAVSYAVMLVAGLAYAAVLARRLEAPEFLIFLPAGVVLFGGTFVHDLQMGLALPLAVALANRVDDARRPLAYLALLVGAVPEPKGGLADIALGAALGFALAWSATLGGERKRFAAGLGGTLAYVGLALVVHKLGGNAGAVPGTFAALPPGQLAEIGWTAYVSSVSHAPTKGEFVMRLVEAATFIAMFVLTAFWGRAVATGGAKARFAGPQSAER